MFDLLHDRNGVRNESDEFFRRSEYFLLFRTRLLLSLQVKSSSVTFIFNIFNSAPQCVLDSHGNHGVWKHHHLEASFTLFKSRTEDPTVGFVGFGENSCLCLFVLQICDSVHC